MDFSKKLPVYSGDKPVLWKHYLVSEIIALLIVFAIFWVVGYNSFPLVVGGVVFFALPLFLTKIITRLL